MKKTEDLEPTNNIDAHLVPAKSAADTTPASDTVLIPSHSKKEPLLVDPPPSVSLPFPEVASSSPDPLEVVSVPVGKTKKSRKKGKTKGVSSSASKKASTPTERTAVPLVQDQPSEPSLAEAVACIAKEDPPVKKDVAPKEEEGVNEKLDKEKKTEKFAATPPESSLTVEATTQPAEKVEQATALDERPKPQPSPLLVSEQLQTPAMTEPQTQAESTVGVSKTNTRRNSAGTVTLTNSVKALSSIMPEPPRKVERSMSSDRATTQDHSIHSHVQRRRSENDSRPLGPPAAFASIGM